MNRHMPRRIELSQQKPDFLDHAGNAFYFANRVERKQCRDFVAKSRDRYPASAVFLWCLVSKGVTRVDTVRDSEGRVLGVSEIRTKSQPPQANFEWYLRDNNRNTYSGGIQSVHYNRRRVVGLIVLNPFRQVVK